MLETRSNSLGQCRLRELAKFGKRITKFGVNFAVCDGHGELIQICEAGRFTSNPQELIEASRQCVGHKASDGPCDNTDVPVWRFGDTNIILATVLREAPCSGQPPEPLGVALIDLGEPSSFDLPSAGSAQANSEYLVEMLSILVEEFHVASKTERHIEMVGTELAQTYEELVLLHKLSTNMKVTESDANFLQMACDSLTEIVQVEGITILLEKTVDDEPKLTVAAGSGLIDVDDQLAPTLRGRLMDEINSGKEALLDSEVDSAFKYDWPDSIRNIIVVPLFGKEKVDSPFVRNMRNGHSIIGLMVAINRIDKQDFDSTDVKLFNSVASGCAVFIENGRLFKDLKELFIGSLKALTNSIDAKDKYTRGHSERVAFISRWIAERLAEREPVEQERIHEIYLAGLLHDIGKIGIEEGVLTKAGKLSEQEQECIKKHPSIGAGILRGIRQMRDIVPGVLCHHERIDGKGYPHGLTGEEIPLTGKIVGVADSFDAMTSKRTYREAMTVEQALEEIRKGLGSQFDEKIGKAFLESDVHQLWRIVRDGFSDIYGSHDFSEYGTAAVGTLIR
ncbi:MAG: HD domain-containing protein [Phycisphaerales bacterium]|nr:MAG: HD domain-containing protein [Phycisphaerales bacterium]